MAYFYLHEIAEFEYHVRVRPGPTADESVAIVHKQKPEGAVLKQVQLQKQGAGVLQLELQKFKLEDAPLFIEFKFRKLKQINKSLCACALAEAVPGKCAADPVQGDPGDQVTLSVTEWTALVRDKLGDPSEWKEEKPERVFDDVKASVKWRVDGKDLDDKGDKVQFTIQKEHAGKMLSVEAYVGDKPTGRATCQVDCRLSVKIVLEDLDAKPLANTSCTITLEGETQTVTTDGDGLMTFRVPKTPVRAKMRITEPPPSLDVDLPVLVDDFPDVTTSRGQQARLRNLGYFFGELAEVDEDRAKDEEDPQSFPSAIEEFQCDQGLPVTGQCDDATQAKLKELHGC